MSTRVKAHRERMTAAGWKQSAIWLPPQAVAALDHLCQTSDSSRQDVIARLILDAGEKPKATPKKAPVKKKKRKVSKKKRAAAEKTTPLLHLDAIGLSRPPEFKPFPGAVSVSAEVKDFPMMDEIKWRSLPREFMGIREAQKHISAFRKAHADATINKRYMLEDKTLMEITATYTDSRPDQRVVYQARNR